MLYKCRILRLNSRQFNSLNGIPSLIVHWRKNKEYTVIRLYQDLVGDWIVSQCRGSLQTAHRQEYTHTILASYAEARSLVLLLNKQHRQQGYKTSVVTETQLDFQFD